MSFCFVGTFCCIYVTSHVENVLQDTCRDAKLIILYFFNFYLPTADNSVATADWYTPATRDMMDLPIC